MDSAQLVPAAGRLTRSFVALELPKDLREPLGAYIASAGAATDGFRWVRPENLHLTLQFLGGIEDSVLECVRSGLTGIDGPAPRLSLQRTGRFGSSRRARVVWVGVDGEVELLRELAAAVFTVTSGCGLAPEQRPFNAHITLARARERSGAPAPALPPVPPLPGWAANRLVLYESRLGREGPTYLPLQVVELRPALR